MTDNQLLVVDDTLVLIDLPSKASRIPAHTPDGRPIRIVGELAASQDHESLIFEEGIEQVRNQTAEELQLPTTTRNFTISDFRYTFKVRLWRRFSREQWRMVAAQCVSLKTGGRIYTGDFSQLNLSFSGDSQQIHWIPEDANELLYIKESGIMKGISVQKLPCVGITKKRDAVMPAYSLLELFRSGNVIQKHPRAEMVSDAYLQRGVPGATKLASYSILVTAEDPIQCPGTDDVLVCFTLQKGIWAFCSVVPVVWNEKKYAVGCLNQLLPFSTPDKGAPYRRFELGVFSQEGLVTNRRITEAVNEKYMLMSLV